MLRSLVGSEMCIRDSQSSVPFKRFAKWIGKESHLSLNIHNAQSTAKQIVTPSPSGDKEYRDTVRSIQRSASPSRSYSPIESSFYSHLGNPSPNRGANQSNRPPTAKGFIFCAWCRENRQPDRHSTKSCESFKSANVEHQWKVRKKHGICVLCLTGQHQFSRCPK